MQLQLVTASVDASETRRILFKAEKVGAPWRPPHNMIATIVLVGLLAYLLYKAYIYPRYVSPLRHLPGPPMGWIPLLGNIPEIIRSDMGAAHERWIKQYGPVFRVYGPLNEPRLFVADPATVQHIVGKQAYTYVKPKMTRSMLELVTGKGLVVSDGADHKRQRKYLQEAFNYKYVKEMAPAMYDVTQQLIASWKSQIQTGESRVLVDEGITKATLEIIGRVGLGYKFNAFQANNTQGDPLYKAYTTMLNSPQSVLNVVGFFFPFSRNYLPYYKRMAKNMQVIDSIVYDIIRKRWEETQQSDAYSKDLLSVMLRHFADEGETTISEEELKAQVLTFAAAGHDTTATALGWTLHLLAQDVRIQDTLRKEIRAHLSMDGVPTADELNKLPYLENVVKEILRLHSPTTLTLRTNLQDDTLPNGLFLPKGTNVTMIKTVMHTLPSIWGEDAHEFRPERWDELDIANIPHFNYIYFPFLTGARACIGSKLALLELKMILAGVVDAFELTPVPGHKVYRKFSVINKPLPNVQVNLKALH
jgi:cytochrome P450